MSPTNPAECCESQVHTGDCIVIGNRQNGCVVGTFAETVDDILAGVWGVPNKQSERSLGRERCSGYPKRIFRTIACRFHGNRL